MSALHPDVVTDPHEPIVGTSLDYEDVTVYCTCGKWESDPLMSPTLAELTQAHNAHVTEALGEAPRLVVRVNSNVTMSRGKAAAQAVHAALRLLGVHHGGAVIVLGANTATINDMPVTIHDAGRTELTPGTLTAGAEWEHLTLEAHP